MPSKRKKIMVSVYFEPKTIEQLRRKIEYLDEISPNYRAWREAQIEIVKQGYKIRCASLQRPVGGFRRASVHVTDETGTAKTLTWFQPWSGDRIDE